MEESTDTRPKFIHFLGQSLLQKRVKKGFFKGSYIELADLIYIQSVMFEFCGFVGIQCDDCIEEFFRVLSTRQGIEKEGFNIAEQVYEVQVGSFIDDAFDPLDLVFRTVRSRTGVDCEFGEFLKQFGGQTLKTDDLGMNIIAWGLHGAVAGLRYPDKVEKLLKWKYSTWQERGFSEEQAKMLEGGLGPNPITFAEAENVAFEIFGEFCKEHYPVEANSFWFV